MSDGGTRTALITGTTSGLGKALAAALGARGWTVLAHGRDQRKLDEVVRALRGDGVDAHPCRADLASLREAADLGERVVREHGSLQLLVNNAGVGSGPPRGRRELSRDGHELHLAVNYLAPVALTRSLLPALRAGAPSHVLNIGSVGMAAVDLDDPHLETRYDGMQAYIRSKYALLAFTVDAARDLAGDGIRVNCVHPATYMDTGMVRESHVTPWTTVDVGVAAVLSVIEDRADTTGEFFDGARVSRGQRAARDDRERARLAMLTDTLLPAT